MDYHAELMDPSAIKPSDITVGTTPPVPRGARTRVQEPARVEQGVLRIKWISSFFGAYRLQGRDTFTELYSFSDAYARGRACRISASEKEGPHGTEPGDQARRRARAGDRRPRRPVGRADRRVPPRARPELQDREHAGRQAAARAGRASATGCGGSRPHSTIGRHAPAGRTEAFMGRCDAAFAGARRGLRRHAARRTIPAGSVSEILKQISPAPLVHRRQEPLHRG